MSGNGLVFFFFTKKNKAKLFAKLRAKLRAIDLKQSFKSIAPKAKDTGNALPPRGQSIAPLGAMHRIFVFRFVMVI